MDYGTRLQAALCRPFGQIAEMALTHGGFKFAQKQGRKKFHDLDRRTIEKMVWHKNLSAALSKSVYDFNIIFYEMDDDERGVERAVARYCEENGVPLEGRITFVKNASNEGEPLRAWMILHCFGHALVDETQGLGYELSHMMYNLGDSFVEALAKDRGVRVFDMPPRLNYTVLHYIFQFGSARNYHGTRDFVGKGRDDEMVHEMIADYIWHGKLRWKQPDNAMIDMFGVPWIGADIKTAVEEMQAEIKTALDESVGQIVTDSRSMN